jgi:uncharacterized GH25 family protein
MMRSLLTLAALSAATLPAHDFWIEPSTFHAEPGRTIGLRLRVGQELTGDPVARNPTLLEQFVVEDSSGRRPVGGRDGADPAGLLMADAPGLLVIGYLSRPSAVELKADAFAQYLKEEGLEAILAERSRRGQSSAPAREIYSRCAKSLVLSGSSGRTQADRVLGFPLELVAERNPYAMGDGGELPLRLMYEKGPLAGALVVAMNRLDPAQKQSARTGRDGRVRIRLRSGGMWLIKAVHMAPAPAGSNAEWASWWASLTFEPLAAPGRRQRNAD